MTTAVPVSRSVWCAVCSFWNTFVICQTSHWWNNGARTLIICRSSLRLSRVPLQNLFISASVSVRRELNWAFRKAFVWITAHPINIGDCLARARRRHHILARPNDKSGMTLKPCTSVQFQRDLKKAVHIRTVSTWSKNKKYSWHDKKTSASCVFITRLLMWLGEPAAAPPESWTAVIPETYVIHCI